MNQDVTTWHDEAQALKLAGRIERIEGVGDGPIFDAVLEDGRVQRVALHPRRGFIVPRRWRKPRDRG